MRVFQQLRRWFTALFRGGLFDRRALRASAVPLVMPPPVTIHRDITPGGIRVYGICNSCGARLEASATLCEECAQGRSRSAPPPY